MTWNTVFAAVAPYIIKIETPAGAGTGFFFAYNQGKTVVAIATALHVIEEADEWKNPIKIVHVNSGKELFLSSENRAVFLDYTRDSAAILITTKAVIDAGLVLPDQMLGMLPSDKYKRIGTDLAWTGYPAIASRTLCLFRGSVSAFNEKNDSYYLDGVAINGVSGGPVFDEVGDAPQIVGIVSAYRFNRQGANTLPGLLMAHDATHLNKTIERIKSLDDAQRQAIQANAEQSVKGTQTDIGPVEPGGSNPSSPRTRALERPLGPAAEESGGK